MALQRIVVFMLSALLFLLAPCAMAEASGNIVRAIYHNNRLWLLSDQGALVSLSETDKDVRHEVPGGLVKDACVYDDKLTAAVTEDSTSSIWLIRTFEQGSWRDTARVTSDGTILLGLVCDNAGLNLLTQDHLFTIRDQTVSQVRLSGDFPEMEVPLQYAGISTAGTETKVWAAFHLGEWGGQLHIIDRISGDRFLTAYGNVTAMASVPWKKDCVAAAIGNIHFLASGEVAIACTDTPETIYKKPFGERFKTPDLPEDEAYQTIPFYGIAVKGGRMTAIGADGIYRINASGKANFTPLPAFRPIGNFSVSFGDPDVVLVATTAYRRTAVTGEVPLMAIK
jgi:hypothetical protein